MLDTDTPAERRGLADRVPRGRLGSVGRAENFWIGMILLLLIVVFTIIAPPHTFLTWSNATNVLLDASELLILASGMTFLLISAGLDLSIGSVVVFCAVISAKAFAGLSGSAAQAAAGHYPHLALAVAVGVVAGILSGTAWGLFNGFVVVVMKVPPFIATLGTAGIALGAAQVISNGINVVGVPLPLEERFGLGKVFGVVPWPVVIVAVAWVTLVRTRFGMRTMAIGANIEAARRAGIRTGLHIGALYAAMGTLAGLVSIID